MREPRYNAHQQLALLAFRHRFPALVEEIGRGAGSADVFADVAAITGEPAHVVRAGCLHALRGVLTRSFEDAYLAMRWLQEKDWRLAVWCSAQIVRSLRFEDAAVQAYVIAETERIEGVIHGRDLDVESDDPDGDAAYECGASDLIFWFHREIECHDEPTADDDRYGMLEVVNHAARVISGKHGYRDNIDTHKTLLPVMADAVLGYPQ